MHCAHRYRSDIMYTVYECTDSPKFTMKLTEIYRYMATHDSHSKFWACDAELTAFSNCRKSHFCKFHCNLFMHSTSSTFGSNSSAVGGGPSQR